MYRLPEEQYYREMECDVDGVLFPSDDPLSPSLRERDATYPNEKNSIRDHLRKKYGGGWRFNEVIGFIRLFFLGTQVRGEYFGVGRKRIRRTRKKIFELRSLNLAPEIEISHLMSNAGILEAVHSYLADCRKELKGRYIDSQLLEQLVLHIDWQKFLLAE